MFPYLIRKLHHDTLPSSKHTRSGRLHPLLRRRNLDTSGFMKKLGRFAGRLANLSSDSFMHFITFGNPNIRPKRAKMIIVGALVYFLSPIDSIPDLLGPLGFSDDIAVITLVYSQMKTYLTEDIKERARVATEKVAA